MVKTSIRVSDETLEKLHKIKGEIESKTGKFTSLDDALHEVLDEYKKRHR